MKKIIDRISSLKWDATKSELKLIEYIGRTHFSDIIYLSITELSEITGIGEATILRFCRKMGYKGYQDFKLSMAKEIDENQKDEVEDTYVATISNELLKSLEAAKQNVDIDAIERAIDIILKSKRISVFGIGNSFVPAMEMHNKLIKMGFFCHCMCDAHLQNMLVSSFTEKDCIILFSVSGCTKDTIDVAEIAKENNVKIIVITSYSKSPLSKFADEIIVSIRRESPVDAGSMQTKIIQMYNVSILTTGIYLRKKGELNKNIDRAHLSVVNKLI